MKKGISRLLVVLMLCVMAGTAAFAKEKSRVITFGQDFVVGETAVKAGTYKITYNDQTNELTFADKKTKEVVAKVKTTVKERSEKSNIIDMGWTTKDGKQVLLNITFPGDKAQLVISGNETASN